MEAAIELKNLTRDYSTHLFGPRLRALDRVTFNVPAGSICGLLGPNGGGKSTTLRLILGLLEPTAGSVRVFGCPAGSLEARRLTGYLPDAPRFSRHLSGRELVCFHARLAGLPKRGLVSRVDELIARVGLKTAADRRIDTYSKGMLQRIGLAQALVHDPRLVILDEPSAGLDPKGADELAGRIALLRAEGRTVLIATHQFGPVEDLCDHVAILDRGGLVLEGSVADLEGAEAAAQALLIDPLPDDELGELRNWLAVRGRRLSGMMPPSGRLARLYARCLGTNDSGGIA